MGLGLKNVVNNDEELRKVIDELYKGIMVGILHLAD
jgi:hypothetical protein